MTESTCTNCPQQINLDGWYTVKNRFEKRIMKTDNCWEWKGHISPYGYGKFSVNEREHWQAHRLSYFLYKGDIPSGMFVLHQCDNRSCVNPKHLRIGTQKENMADMHARGRFKSSPKAGKRRLTLEKVNDIRKSYPTKSIRVLAREFDVSRDVVAKVVKNKSWNAGDNSTQTRQDVV